MGNTINNKYGAVHAENDMSNEVADKQVNNNADKT